MGRRYVLALILSVYFSAARGAFLAPALAGCLCASLDMEGFVVPVRNRDIDGYATLRTMTDECSSAIAELGTLAVENRPAYEFVDDATRIFHAAIAHVSPAGVQRMV